MTLLLALSLSLLVRKLGLALLGESSHSFLLVLGREERLEEAALEAGTLLQAELEGCVATISVSIE